MIPARLRHRILEKYIQIGKKGGLGIFMMRKLMDDVQYNITSRGNELRLTKQRDEVDLSQYACDLGRISHAYAVHNSVLLQLYLFLHLLFLFFFTPR